MKTTGKEMLCAVLHPRQHIVGCSVINATDADVLLAIHKEKYLGVLADRKDYDCSTEILRLPWEQGKWHITQGKHLKYVWVVDGPVIDINGLAMPNAYYIRRIGTIMPAIN